VNDWLDNIRKILESDSVSLKDLATLSGADVSIFYVNQDLSKCDLRGQDLAGINLSGTGITEDQLDKFTKIDPEFDPRFVLHSEYISLRLSIELTSLVYGFADANHYIYRAWAFKNLIESGLNCAQSNRDYETFITENSRFCDVIYKKGKSKRFQIQIYPSIQERAFRWAKNTGKKFSPIIYNELILIGLISRSIRNISAKDYSAIRPLSLFSSAHHHYEHLSGKGSV
jgi:hypothetical protein